MIGKTLKRRKNETSNIINMETLKRSGIKLVIYLFFATQRRHMYTTILIL